MFFPGQQWERLIFTTFGAVYLYLIPCVYFTFAYNNVILPQFPLPALNATMTADNVFKGFPDRLYQAMTLSLSTAVSAGRLLL